MPAGRPRKRPRDTSGLRNQKKQHAQDELTDQDNHGLRLDNDSVDGSGAAEAEQGVFSDAGMDFELLWERDELLEGEEMDPGPESDVEELSDYEFEWDDEELQENLIDFAEMHGDDPEDEDWHPNLHAKKKKKTGRPKHYIKGPDVMSKSARTRRRYTASNQGQQKLNLFLGSAMAKPNKLHHVHNKSPVSLPPEMSVEDEIQIQEESVEVEIPEITEDPVQIHEESIEITILLRLWALTQD
ncbi:hypothetical protein H0H81_009867 [Sphagnurus paluster]|uniref:Uncharacterized protein n=1 Tax=Sphagnurus paluster TaxID=117069 RepID=A0A9P7KKZ2_9AGAR|nr:hypothetical protein H0H81_009867 [Sphagnurus paluster]